MSSGKDARITKEQVVHVSKLARLNLSEEEIRKFEGELNDILETFRTLDSVDTKGVEPAFHPIEVRDNMREDAESRVCTPEELLESSKEREGTHIKGPRVV